MVWLFLGYIDYMADFVLIEKFWIPSCGCVANKYIWNYLRKVRHPPALCSGNHSNLKPLKYRRSGVCAWVWVCTGGGVGVCGIEFRS